VQPQPTIAQLRPSQQSKISPQIHASLHSHRKQQQQRIRLYATKGTHNSFQGKLINSCHVTSQVSSLMPHQHHVTSAHHASAAQLRATSTPHHPICYSFCHLNNYGGSFLPSQLPRHHCLPPHLLCQQASHLVCHISDNKFQLLPSNLVSESLSLLIC